MTSIGCLLLYITGSADEGLIKHYKWSDVVVQRLCANGFRTYLPIGRSLSVKPENRSKHCGDRGKQVQKEHNRKGRHRVQQHLVGETRHRVIVR